MSETPTVYYPSCVVDFRILFDEALTLATTATGTPIAPAFSDDTLSDARSPETKSTGNPQIFAGQSDEKLSHVTARIPKKVSVELPAYREAGTFHITMDYRDLPIDPRLVRSCAVEIYLDTVMAFEFGIGMAGRASQFDRASILPSQKRLSQLQPNDSNLLMVGIVDTWNVAHSSSGSTVTLKGRDLRGLLLNSPFRPQTLNKLPLRGNIKEVVEYLVKSHPAGGKIKTGIAPEDEWPDLKWPSPGGEFTTRVRKGASGDKNNGSAGGDPNSLNYWDVISKYCSLVGAVPYFKGNTLYIAPSRNLYDNYRDSTQPKTPKYPSVFNKERASLGVEGNIRQFIFGNNVEEMNFERKYTGKKTTAVEVTSFNTSSSQRGSGKALTARWPAAAPKLAGAPAAIQKDPEKARATSKQPSGSTAQEDITRITIPGIADKARLLQLAQDIYEEIGRGEMGGSVSTKSLASFGGYNNDPDLVRLRPGDAVRIGIGESGLNSTSTFLSPPNLDASASDATLLKELQQRGLDTNLAKALILSTRNYVKGLENVFRVSNVKYSWDNSTGVSISFDFANYIRARAEVTQVRPRSGLSPKTATRTATPRTGG